MELTDKDRLERVRYWMRELQVNPVDAHWLVDELMQTDIKHGYRAVTFQGAAKRLGRIVGPDARAHFEQVAKEIKLPRLFSIVSLDDTMILNALQAGHYMPGAPLADGLARTMEFWMADMRNSPLTSIMQLATRDNAWNFLKMQSKSLHNWQNFGEVKAELVHERHATSRGTDLYPYLIIHMMPHVVRGLLRIYEPDGRVEARVNGEGVLIIDVKW